MAKLGFRTLDEMIGRVDKLEVNPDVLHYKSRGLDLSALLTPATSLNENHSGVTKRDEQVRAEAAQRGCVGAGYVAWRCASSKSCTGI